jgi:hypothetical protein
MVGFVLEVTPGDVIEGVDDVVFTVELVVAFVIDELGLAAVVAGRLLQKFGTGGRNH